MKRKIIFSFLFSIILVLSSSGQQYTARGYWKMEHDSTFNALLNLQLAGAVLSNDDQSFIDSFKARLAIYFQNMPDQEKSDYYKYRTSWNENPGRADLREEDQVYAGERSTYSQYIVASGLWGAVYGGALDVILGIDGGAAAGIPLITGGLGAILPIATIKDKKVTTNSLLLSLHGKAIGAFQGAMLGLLVTGQSIDTEGGGKFTLGLATASSITLGRIGFNLGKTKNWTQGRVSLYSHYGWLMPLEAIAVTAAFNIDEPRIYGLVSLAGGVGGYLLADRVADRNNFTRGDMTSVTTLTLLNTMLGAGIMSDVNTGGTASILIPAATTMAGTLLGQVWMRNARLSNQQGRNIALASTAGAVVGLGFSVMIFQDASSFNYILPYMMGLVTYSVIAETYRKKNVITPVATGNPGRFHISIMPQNIFINNKLMSSGRITPGGSTRMLPAFAASITF